MPKVQKDKHKVIHPNSRKALQLTRETHRQSKLERRQEEQKLKQNVKLKKLLWFKDNLLEEKEIYNTLDMKNLIERYLHRNDEQDDDLNEAKQIKGRKNQERMKQQFGQQFVTEKESEDFKTCGLEVPNLMAKSSSNFFRKWDGDIRFLSSIELICLSEKKLDHLISKEKGKAECIKDEEKMCEDQELAT